jgi:hypothetical protein
MNVKTRSAGSLVLALGLLASGAILPSPAASGASGTPDFEVDLRVLDGSGAEVTRTGANLTGGPLTIAASVAVAEGRPDSPNTTILLDINGMRMDGREFGPLYRSRSPDSARYSYCWTPESYGEYEVAVTVQNGPDEDNRTVVSVPCLPVRSSDLRLTQVFADRSRAVIGRTELTIYAAVENFGNRDGEAKVDFWLDGDAFLGSGRGAVRAGTREHVKFSAVFGPEAVAEGDHVVTGTMADLVGTRKTTGWIAFRLPSEDLKVASFEVLPETIIVAKGDVACVGLTATIANSGKLPQANFTVGFFDKYDALAAIAVDRAVAPGGSLCVQFAWNLTDKTAAGRHNLSAGMDGQHPERDVLPGANLTVLRVAGVAVVCLSVSPAMQYEGREVVLSARMVNAGRVDVTGLEVRFQAEDPAGGAPAAIGRLTGIGILAGGSAQAGLGWTLPSISSEKETRTVEAVMDGEVQASVVVTVLRSRPQVEVEKLRLPEDVRVGDRVTMSAVVVNVGNSPVEGIRVDFCDGNLSLASSPPFDIPAGESDRLEVFVTIPGPGDAVHVFSARADEAVCLVPRMVGHRLAPANIRIAGFSVDPDFKDARSGSSEQELVLVLVLQNTGELPGMATVSIIDGEHETIEKGRSIVARPGNNTTGLFLWVVRGGGVHRAFATVGFDDLAEKAATEVDIPYAAPEPDRPTIAAAGTAAVLVFNFLLAVAARRWKARSVKARPAVRRAGGPVVVVADRRVELDPPYERPETAMPRTGKRWLPGESARGTAISVSSKTPGKPGRVRPRAPEAPCRERIL